MESYYKRATVKCRTGCRPWDYGEKIKKERCCVSEKEVSFCNEKCPHEDCTGDRCKELLDALKTNQKEDKKKCHK